MTDEIHVNDSTDFRLEINDDDAIVNISQATVKNITFKKPDCSVVTKTATFLSDGSDGIIRYTCASGDLNLAGNWRIQGFVTLPSGSYSSSIQSFRVFENL